MDSSHNNNHNNNQETIIELNYISFLSPNYSKFDFMDVFFINNTSTIVQHIGKNIYKIIDGNFISMNQINNHFIKFVGFGSNVIKIKDMTQGITERKEHVLYKKIRCMCNKDGKFDEIRVAIIYEVIYGNDKELYDNVIQFWN